jgi:hypothetical protein
MVKEQESSPAQELIESLHRLAKECRTECEDDCATCKDLQDCVKGLKNAVGELSDTIANVLDEFVKGLIIEISKKVDRTHDENHNYFS